MNTEATLPNTADFRLFLQQELMRRCRTNRAYSLRAFARFLGVSPSFLSHLFKGERSVTSAIVSKLATRLELGPEEVEAFRSFHRRKTKRELRAEAKAGTGAAATAAPDYRQLTLDQFQVIADWYHYAILELVALDHFQPEARWVARTLGITAAEVHAAVERLERLGMLEITSEGRWINASGSNTTIGNPFTAVAFKKLQRQVLAMAIDALDEFPIEERDQSSYTMAIDSSLVPEIKATLKDFRRKLAEFEARSARRDRVYNVSLSLYPVTKKPETRENEEKRKKV